MKNSQTIYQIIENSARVNPNGYVYNFFNHQQTYCEFLVDIDRCAAYLNEIGCKNGDVITICLPNIPRAIILFYAINKIGAICHFLHPQMPVDDYKNILLKMKPKAIFILDSLYEQYFALQDLLIYKYFILVRASEFMPLKLKYFTMLKETFTKLKHSLDTHTFYYSDKHITQINSAYNRSTNDTAVILFSGGTTSNSKGICLSDFNINSSAAQTATYRTHSSTDDKMLAILPLFHGYGLVSCVHTTIMEKSQLILLPYYESKLFIKTFLRHKPNYIVGIPKLYKRMSSLIEPLDVDLSFLRGLYCGGSHLNEKLRRHFNHILESKNSPVYLQSGYGLTECVAACALMPSDRHINNSVGKPFPGAQFKVVDVMKREDLPNGSVGQIIIQSDAVMIGYYGENKQPFEYREDGRWLCTDDLGYIDEQGYIFIVDRLSRMVKISGYAVYPAKIEKLLNEIDGVANSCVVPYTIKGIQYLKAYIKLSSSTEKLIETQELTLACSKKLPRWSIPKEFIFVNTIPQTLYSKNDYRKMINS